MKPSNEIDYTYHRMDGFNLRVGNNPAKTLLRSSYPVAYLTASPHETLKL